ncbi:hypothetical protein [Paracidovorax valerianellae]|uniref:Uncharacterized protein n=1 Tax=Paracidovorax valerianellae TaxID=187868 RepID=A0A1G7BVJ5_9BURK|nr:hypothetical protein [Paracidovorax valerianellae]MDA8446646.1 hypothetical protein [Paracidovorax valerianellae]SDE31151.1 hypothetical protein SAMN05192589_11511 [Paracidovorax valerianellae]
MKTFIASALMLLAPALVMAQDAAPAKPAPAKTPAKAAPAKAAPAKAAAKEKSADAKPAAKPAAKSAAKPAATSKKATSSRTQLKSATNQVATGIIAAEAALTPQELAIAERVHTGHIPCELGASVHIEADAKSPGHFRIDGKGFNYYMSPIATSTGAVRLEDQKAGAVWIQIANKSMLMNQKLGQRLADECMSPQQVAVTESIKKNPQPSLLEALPASATAPATASAPAAPAPAQ